MFSSIQPIKVTSYIYVTLYSGLLNHYSCNFPTQHHYVGKSLSTNSPRPDPAQSMRYYKQINQRVSLLWQGKR